MNYAKYENFIQVGDSPETLENFPTPSSLGRTLRDLDKDPFTDLEGYTHRNRVRIDVEQLVLNYNVLSEEDEKFILEAIQNEWFYVRIKDKKTRQYKTLKMYASDRAWDTFQVFKNNENDWETTDIAFSVTFTQQ